MNVVSHEDGSIDDFPVIHMPDEHNKNYLILNEKLKCMTGIYDFKSNIQAKIRYKE